MVQAQNPFANLSFPISELGNCPDLASCKTYCDNPENISSCLSYGKSHGLIPNDAPAEKPQGDQKNIDEVLKGGKGPGGCTDQNSCHAYCSDISHIKECIAFGKSHNLLSKSELAEADKISRAIANGVTTPGNCTTKKNCEDYCLVSAHVDECIAFAEKSGILGAEDVARAKQFRQLQGAGQTPGGCSDKNSCQSYCSNQAHEVECRAFADKMGFDHGRSGEPIAGPGGCNSAESCASFCNAPANQDACISFAREHGFIENEDGAKGATESLSNIAAGLNNTPAEVQNCLQSSLGQDGFSALQSGAAPSLDSMHSVRQCFESFKPQLQQQFRHQFTASSEVKDCITGAVGADVLDKIEKGDGPPDPLTAQKMRQCFDQSSEQQQQRAQQERRANEADHGGVNPSGQSMPRGSFSGSENRDGNYQNGMFRNSTRPPATETTNDAHRPENFNGQNFNGQMPPQEYRDGMPSQGMRESAPGSPQNGMPYGGFMPPSGSPGDMMPPPGGYEMQGGGNFSAPPAEAPAGSPQPVSSWPSSFHFILPDSNVLQANILRALEPFLRGLGL